MILDFASYTHPSEILTVSKMKQTFIYISKYGSAFIPVMLVRPGGTLTMNVQPC